jgi:hypothetical protein
MIDQDEDNPFSAFTDSAAIMAFVHASCGEIALKELLVALNADRETLTGHAEVLAEMGLQQITDIVLEHASHAPSTASENPLDEDLDPANHKDWNRRHLGDFEGFMLDDEDRADRVRSFKRSDPRNR